MDLKEYEHCKFELSAILRNAALRIENRDSEIQRRVDDLFARLAEDRFNLVVVGRFSRGKSTLMNALIGTDRLPTGMVPLTSVITTVGYGTKERAIIEHGGWALGTEIPLEKLPEYVTQRGNPGNVKQVALARIELPSELLRRGFYFVDTPGLGSAIIENTRTTERYLPQADAFMLVTSFDSPLSEEEFDVLRDVAKRMCPVFVVINKSDLASEAERSDVMRHMRAEVERASGDVAPRLFAVSARDGMDANRSHDADRLSTSGVQSLKDELTRFLLTEKQSHFLIRMGERIAGVIDELPGTGDDAQRLGALRKRLARESSPSPNALPSMSPPSGNVGPRFFGCPVCDRIEREMYAFLCQFQYDVLTRSDVQKGLADRGGLCPRHLWQYASVASPRGTCIGFTGVLEDWSKRLRQLAAKEAMLVSLELGDCEPDAEQCDLCRARARFETKAVFDAAQRISTEPAAPFTGVCLPHLCLLVASLHGQALRHLLIDQATAMENLAEDMQRYALKHDGVRRYLASAEESHADARALTLLGGNRNVNG